MESDMFQFQMALEANLSLLRDAILRDNVVLIAKITGTESAAAQALGRSTSPRVSFHKNSDGLPLADVEMNSLERRSSRASEDSGSHHHDSSRKSARCASTNGKSALKQSLKIPHPTSPLTINPRPPTKDPPAISLEPSIMSDSPAADFTSAPEGDEQLATAIALAVLRSRRRQSPLVPTPSDQQKMDQSSAPERSDQVDVITPPTSSFIAEAQEASSCRAALGPPRKVLVHASTEPIARVEDDPEYDTPEYDSQRAWQEQKKASLEHIYGDSERVDPVAEAIYNYASSMQRSLSANATWMAARDTNPPGRQTVPSFPGLPDDDDALRAVKSDNIYTRGKSMGEYKSEKSAKRRVSVLDDDFMDDNGGRNSSMKESAADDDSESDEEVFAIADYWLTTGTARRQKSLRNPSIAMSTHFLNLAGTKALDEGQAGQQREGRTSHRTTRSVMVGDHHSLETVHSIMRKWMLEPYSRKLVFWEFFGCIMVLYDIVTIPLEAFDPPRGLFWLTMPWVIRLFWTTDIVLSFLTGYVNSEGTKIMDPKLVAKRYMIRQFPFDLFVVLADWTEVIIQNRFVGFLKIRRFFRVARFIRLKKAKETQEKIKEFLSTHLGNEAKVNRLAIVFSVTRTLIGLLLLIHLICCTWYATSSLSMGHGNPTWVEDLVDRPFLDRYLESFHFAIALFLGEHADLPRNTVERGLVIFVLFCCFIGQIWLISVLTTSMTHLEIVSARRTQMFNTLERYLFTHQISRELALKVQRNADHALKEQDRNVPEEHITLLQLISEPLKIELHYEIYSASLFAHPFFKCYSLVNPAGVRSSLHSGAAFMLVLKGDVVFVEGEMPRKPHRMLMINSGQLSYLRYQTTIAKAVTDRNWLCEGLLWVSDWVHLGTCRAESDCKLMSFDVETFQQAVGMYPSEHVFKYAHNYIRHLNEQASQCRTDVGDYTEKLGAVINMLFKDIWQDIKPKYEQKLTRAHTKTQTGMNRLLRHSLTRQSSVMTAEARNTLMRNSLSSNAAEPRLENGRVEDPTQLPLGVSQAFSEQLSGATEGDAASMTKSDTNDDAAMLGVTKSDIAMLRERARIHAETATSSITAKNFSHHISGLSADSSNKQRTSDISLYGVEDTSNERPFVPSAGNLGRSSVNYSALSSLATRTGSTHSVAPNPRSDSVHSFQGIQARTSFPSLAPPHPGGPRKLELFQLREETQRNSESSYGRASQMLHTNSDNTSPNMSPTSSGAGSKHDEDQPKLERPSSAP